MPVGKRTSISTQEIFYQKIDTSLSEITAISNVRKDFK